MKAGKHVIWRIITALFLVGCAVGPNFKRPEITSPEKFTNDSLTQQDTVLNLKWWEMFNDKKLDSLILIALEQNKDLLIATSRLDQSRANLGIYRADFYPQLNIGAGVYSGNYGGGIFVFDGQREALSVNGQLTWELDFWGKIRRSTESAKAEMLATEYGLRAVQIGVITEVARNYFLLLDYRARYEISKRTYASRDSGHQIILARFNGGIVPEIDVNQSQIQLSISEAAVPLYERRVNEIENNLSLLIGKNPESFSVSKTLFEQEIEAEIPAGIPSSILNRRPDLLAAEAQLHAQTSRVGIAQANRLPSITLTGLLGTVSTDLSSLTTGTAGWNVSAGLLGPLFQFNKNKRRVDVEREKTKQALLTYEKSVLQAFGEVELALKNIETSNMELQARKKQMDAALNAEHLSFERYNKGITSYLEVLETQRSSFEAGLTYSNTYQQLLNSYVLLYKALGGGWISEEEMNAANAEQKK